jgi:hypothetical protein
MSLDKRVEIAIDEAVQEIGETPALAEKIKAWLGSLVAGNDRLAERDSTERHVELLYSSVSAGADEGPQGE